MEPGGRGHQNHTHHQRPPRPAGQHTGADDRQSEGQARNHHCGAVDGHPRAQLTDQGVPVRRPLHESEDNRAREEHERIRVPHRAGEPKPPYPRALHDVEPDDEEWDRRLRHQGQQELPSRESILGELDHIRKEVEKREGYRGHPDQTGQVVPTATWARRATPIAV